jgi:S1-C subfamily serine protease
VHGLLGYNILARYRIELDMSRDKMKWTPLDYRPDVPHFGHGGMPVSINALGAMMKIAGLFLGRKAIPNVTPRGFLGMEWEAAENGVVIRSVLADGPAARAGVKPGDRIMRIQDKAIRKPADASRAAATLKVGDMARLTIQRGQETREISFAAGEGL